MATLHPYLGVSKKKGYATKAVNKCNKENQRRYALNLHKKNDRALIKWLESNKPYQTTLKKLIREEMAREKAMKKMQTNVDM